MHIQAGYQQRKRKEAEMVDDPTKKSALDPQDLLSAGRAFNYDQFTLVPRVISTLAHRAEAQPTVQLGHFRLTLPLLGSPMPDVCGADCSQREAKC